MAKKIKPVEWKFPTEEDDYDTHVLIDTESTVCGLFYEGVGNERKGDKQNFVNSKKALSCKACIQIIKFCQSLELIKH